MSAKDDDKLIADHSYDGIQEYDNPMPPWWTNLFWGTIIFSVGYCAYYMIGSGPTMTEEYLAERATFASQPPQSAGTPQAEELVRVAANPQMIDAGKKIFESRCSPCHGATGGGTIGPNLTDTKWIHGGSIENIYHVISEGVLDKGMIAWKSQLSRDEMMQVTAFVRSIQNTNVSGKSAEGNDAAPTPLS